MGKFVEQAIEEIIRLQKENNVLQNKVNALKEENEVIKNRLQKMGKLHKEAEDIHKELHDDSDRKEVMLRNFLNRQQRIFQNKVNHNFNVTNVYQEARYILEEVTELMRAIEKNDRENMVEELADIVIFAYGCTEVARLGDLDTKIFEKMSLNEKREYKQNSEGDFVKVNNQ